MDKGKVGFRSIRGAWWVLWRVVLPFGSMWKSVELSRREVERHKENLRYIGELRDQALGKSNEADGGVEESSPDVGFEQAIAQRGDGALSETELRRLFVMKKRWALGVGAVFIVMALFSGVSGLLEDQARPVWLSLFTLVVALPGFFILALGAQLRIWQLDTKRLSIAERGGLQDFYRDCPGWAWKTLNPEFTKRGGR